MRLLSGRYRSDKLLSHFSSSNSPKCQLECDEPDAVGDLHHFLLKCSALSARRSVLFDYWDVIVSNNPTCIDIIRSIKVGSDEQLLQFLLDCSTVPEVISLAQIHGDGVYASLFKMTRTFCYSLHRERLKRLNRWKS